MKVERRNQLFSGIQPRGTFMKILVIEDDKKTADFLLKALKEAGYTTIHATDGRTGLMTA